MTAAMAQQTSKDIYAAANKACTWKTCTRCKGTGIWSQFDRGGVCFGCGGIGRKQVWNDRAKELHRQAHIIETQEQLEKARQFLSAAEDKAKTGGATFGLSDRRKRVAELEKLLSELRAGTHWSQRA
jgi:hypothetical protein